MANRKQLKKTIKYATSELLADCFALSLCKEKEDQAIAEIVVDVLHVRTDFVSRLSHVEKGREAVFFKKLHEEFIEKVNALSDRIIQA